MSETFPSPFGRYQLTERLAVGGMAELFRATVSGAHGFQKHVVIKRILPHLAADQHFNRMFIDEAKITARLSHPKIAQTLELGKFNGQLYIAMEYVDGLDVLAVLRECAHRRTRIPLPVSVFVIHEVLDALDFAHHQTDADGEPLNIVHRDISPSNILVSRRGDVKLVDFGIAQATEREQNTQAGTLKGKYGYMAPEQVVGGHVDARSDLFSAGVVLAEMAMGRRLFTAPNELDVLLMVRDVKLDRLDRYGRGIEPGLLDILRRALVKSPGERYQTAGEFREAVSEWLFEHRHRVGARDLAGLIRDLYADAWERKRAQKAALDAAAADGGPASASRAGRAAGEILGELDLEGQGNPGADSVGGAASDHSAEGLAGVPSSTEDAIAMVATAGDGVPESELLTGAESEPVVLIERSSGGAPRPAQVAGGRQAPLTARRASAGDSQAFAPPDLAAIDDHDTPGYDLGALSDELELGPAGTGEHEAPFASSGAPPARDPRDPPPELEDVPELPGAHITQEIAFDDVVVSVERTPRDESGRCIEPSDAELERARAKRPSITSPGAPPDDEGSLSETSPIRVMCRLANARATGLLIVELGPIRKEIYVREGCAEYVSSNVASELFGEYLVAHKVISDGELSMALAMMPHYGGKLGDTLVGLGLMKPLDVFRQLTRQVRDKLIDVCTWSKGRFEWYEGRRNNREAFPLDLDAYEVLGAGAMQIPIDRIEQWCGSVLDVKLRSVKAKVRPELFRIGPETRAAFNMLDGSRTIGELAMRYTDPDERDRFVRILFLLVASELAQPM